MLRRHRGRPPVLLAGAALLVLVATACRTGPEHSTSASREDFFEVTAPDGTYRCRIWGTVTRRANGDISLGVSATATDVSNRWCSENAISAEVVYDPDPADAAVSIAQLTGKGNELNAWGLPVPNFKFVRYELVWNFDEADPDAVQRAGPFTVPVE